MSQDHCATDVLMDSKCWKLAIHWGAQQVRERGREREREREGEREKEKEKERWGRGWVEREGERESKTWGRRVSNDINADCIHALN